MATAADVAAFVADLETHRDRSMALAMVLGGLRTAAVRGLRLADVDLGMRQLRVFGKRGRERLVPVDAAFFADGRLSAFRASPRVPDRGVLVAKTPGHLYAAWAQ
jgi:site-specific recombinase XerC